MRFRLLLRVKKRLRRRSHSFEIQNAQTAPPMAMPATTIQQYQTNGQSIMASLGRVWRDGRGRCRRRQFMPRPELGSLRIVLHGFDRETATGSAASEHDQRQFIVARFDDDCGAGND